MRQENKWGERGTRERELGKERGERRMKERVLQECDQSARESGARKSEARERQWG